MTATEDSFYLRLPSNTSNNYFHNTTSNFKIQLPQALQLEGKWQVALTEISYPVTLASKPDVLAPPIPPAVTTTSRDCVMFVVYAIRKKVEENAAGNRLSDLEPLVAAVSEAWRAEKLHASPGTISGFGFSCFNFSRARSSSISDIFQQINETYIYGLTR